MARNRHARWNPQPVACDVGGEVVLTVTYRRSGVTWEPKPGLRRVSVPEKGLIAFWLASRVSGMTWDDAFTVLFCATPRRTQGEETP